jgi:hypothetical protein
MKPPTIAQLKAHARRLPGPVITMPHLYRFIDHANQYRPSIWSREEDWGVCLLRWWSFRQDHPPNPRRCCPAGEAAFLPTPPPPCPVRQAHARPCRPAQSPRPRRGPRPRLRLNLRRHPRTRMVTRAPRRGTEHPRFYMTQSPHPSTVSGRMSGVQRSLRVWGFFIP